MKSSPPISITWNRLSKLNLDLRDEGFEYRQQTGFLLPPICAFSKKRCTIMLRFKPIIKSLMSLSNNAHSSGRAITKLPSAVTMTLLPWTSVLSTFCKKLFGIPVVRLILGRPSNSGSSLVGQFCIQCPVRGDRKRYCQQDTQRQLLST